MKMNFSFITDRPLWQNILAGFGISFLLVGFFLLMLNVITNHGEYLVVPDVKGKQLDDVQSSLEQKGFEVVIQDSIYVDSLAPNIIIKQFPDPEATVKVNRVVYLTINRTVPPTIPMPNLIGMSLRNALSELKSVGLKLGDTSYVPDIAKNAIKDQLVDGVSIKPGSPVRMGSSISLYVGTGLGGAEMPVPDLFGMTYGEAKLLLQTNGISTGLIMLDEGLVDTTAGFIYWQNPPPYDAQNNVNVLRVGQLVDIKLSMIKPERPPIPETSNNQ
jgi:beta-lactam-binding protein with PASTA domain